MSNDHLLKIADVALGLLNSIDPSTAQEVSSDSLRKMVADIKDSENWVMGSSTVDAAGKAAFKTLFGMEDLVRVSMFELGRRSAFQEVIEDSISRSKRVHDGTTTVTQEATGLGEQHKLWEALSRR